MSDQNNAATFTEQGNAQPEAQPQKFLTIAEVQALLAAAEERTVRRVQGLTDKADSRIQKEVRTQLKNMEDMLKLSGVTMTPEQKEAMKQRVIAQTLSAEVPPESSEPPPPQTSVPGQKTPDPISLAGWEIMRDMGATIEEGDPEVAQLDTTSPGKWLASIPAAVAAKKSRLAQQPAPPVRTPTNAGAGGVVLREESVDDMTSKLKILQSEPTKNWKEIAELSGKLKKLLPRK